MNIEISPEQQLLMIHALDLAISDIEEQLRSATPKNKRFCEVFRFAMNGIDNVPPFQTNEQKYALVDEHDHVVPPKLAKLMSRGILERLSEYRGLRTDLLKLSETPPVRGYNKREQDELR